eukprot:Lankesteria_metandrocarpae@DN9610_c0_g1_i1.p3
MSYKKHHLVGAVSYNEIKEKLQEYCQETTVVLYGSKPDSEIYRKLFSRIFAEGIEPAKIYILSSNELLCSHTLHTHPVPVVLVVVVLRTCSFLQHRPPPIQICVV